MSEEKLTFEQASRLVLLGVSESISLRLETQLLGLKEEDIKWERYLNSILLQALQIRGVL